MATNIFEVPDKSLHEKWHFQSFSTAVKIQGVSGWHFPRPLGNFTNIKYGWCFYELDMSCKLNVNDGCTSNERNGQVLFLDQGNSLKTFAKIWYSSPFMPIQNEERLWIKVIFSSI